MLSTNDHPKEHAINSSARPFRVAILGGGSAGLCMAKQLVDIPGASVRIFERDEELGGLLKSIDVDGKQFDVGTFQFFDGHGVLDTFEGIKGQFVPVNYKPKVITPHYTIDAYPFSFSRFRKDNGLFTLGQAGFSLLYSKFRWRGFTSVPGFARYYLGDVIYRTSGLQRYIYRLHDVPDEEIDLEFAKYRMTRISGQSLRILAKKQFGKIKAKLTGSRFFEPYARQRYVRPKGGMKEVFKYMESNLREAGVEISLGTSVQQIRKTGDGFELMINDQWTHFDRVVSTIPIPVMLRLIGQKCDVEIEARTLISLFYTGKFKPQAPVFFNFTSKARWKRITVFSKFYGMEDGLDYFTVETTTAESNDALIEELRQEFEAHISECDVLEEPPNFLGKFVSPSAYPIYRKGQTPAVDEQKQKLRDFGIDLVGRQGNFEYIISHWVANRASDKSKEIRQQWNAKPSPVG